MLSVVQSREKESGWDDQGDFGELRIKLDL